jgi:tetratricopeptide (TPR) repeat protein
MYSRLAFADISGFNPNVFYEIGARHSAHESGTVLFRQTGHAIPFDITSIKVFEYQHDESTVKKTCAFITKVLSETLKRNRLDSPVRLALRAQKGLPPAPALTPEASAAETAPSQIEPQPIEAAQVLGVDRFMRDAEEALRLGDLDLAKTNYWVVLRIDPLNTIARMRLGLVHKRMGDHYQALEEFTTVTKLAPDYGEAWKEKGIVEGQIARKIPPGDRPTWLPDGHSSLERATMLIPNDFDAWASLGGVLKNVRSDNAGALAKYTHAAKISDGHPYPLLNALKLEAQTKGKLELKRVRKQLKAAEEMRRAQTLAIPPTDTPWCYFDLAELRLYQDEQDGFLENVKKGIESCNADWQPATFANTLHKTLVENNIQFAGLTEGLKLLDEAVERLKN